MFRRLAAVAVILLSPTRAAFAHGSRIDPENWWTAWNRDPLALLSVGLIAWLYRHGLCRMRNRADRRSAVRSWQAIAFFVSLIVILAALISPLDALSEELSSAHMVQHMLLMTIAAPLFVLGSPNLVLSWGAFALRPSVVLRSMFRMAQAPLLRRPVFAGTLFATTLWGWHHPRLYESALREPLVHDLQHLSFFAAACLFWRTAIDPLNGRRLRPPMVIFYLFAASLQASALGAFLALSPRTWYAEYLDTTSLWGLAPLEDQQLAGMMMWIPGCLVYPAAAAVLQGLWLANAASDGSRTAVCGPRWISNSTKGASA